MRTILLSVFLIFSVQVKSQWSELTPDTTFFHMGVYFNNASKGTAVGLDGIYQRTYDGGITWDTTDIQFDDWSLCARNPYSSDLFAICFPSDTVGYIGGQDGDLFKTTNGGFTWFCQSMLPTWDNVEDVYFFDNDSGIATTVYTVFRTTDGGQSWTAQLPPVWPTRIAPVNDSTVLLGGAKIWRSTDYGMTWNATNCDTTIGFHDISMGDSLNGVAVAWAGKIMRTSDGGLNWTSPVQIATVRISNVAMRNDSFGVITLGDSWQTNWQQHDIGYVMYTLDGGVTWLQPDTIGTKTMTDLFMVSDSVAFACGWLGNLMKTEHIIRPSGVGIAEQSTPRQPLVFPNPATETIYVSLPGIQSTVETTLYISDITGRIVQTEQQFNLAPYQIDVSSLPAGVYFLHCTVNGAESVSKFIVQ